MKCRVCGGPYHPATGHLWDHDFAVCGPCFRHFLAWLKHYTREIVLDGCDFAKARATSIRAK